MNYLTKKTFILFGLIYLFYIPLWGQIPGFDINDASSAGGGNNIQVDITVSDFENVASFDFYLIWDTNQLTFNSVGNFNLQDLDVTSFGYGQTDQGTLIVGWYDPDASGEDRDDDSVIFSLFFSAPCGSTASATVSTDPGEIMEVGVVDPNNAYTPIISPSTISFSPGIEISAASISQMTSCNGADDACISVTAIDGNTPYSYLWSNGATTAEVCNLAPGTYNCTVTDAGNCTAILGNMIQITEPDALEICQNNITSLTCLGGDDACIDLATCGGIPPYSYDWNNNETTSQICDLTAGNYDCTITDDNGCTVSTTIVISEPSAPITLADFTELDATCVNGGSIDLTIEGGSTPYTYDWSNNDQTEDIDDLVAGNYTCTITDDDGCSIITQTFSIELSNDDLSANNTITSIDCFGDANGAIDLTVNGMATPFEFLWSNAEETEDISNLGPGSYSCTITDNNGCSLILSDLVVTQPDSPLSISSTDLVNILCNGEETGSINLNISGGTDPYDYLWNDGTTNANINDLPSGEYSCTITDDNGCSTSTTLQVTEPDLLEVCENMATSPTCLNGTDGCILLEICGGSSGYSYAWNNGATTDEICDLSAGTYSCTITDDNGCTTSTSINLNETSNPIALSDFSETNATCAAGGSIDLTIEGGSTPYVYNWSNNASIQDLNDLAAGNYTCTITDGDGCAITTQTFIIEQTDSDISTTNNTTPVSCFGEDDGTIDLIPAGTATPFQYNWSNSATTEDIDNLVAGQYSCTVTDANGCSLVVSNIEVEQPDASLTLSSTNSVNVLCHGEETGSLSLNITGGSLPYAYLWDTGATTSSINNLPAGDYFCTITDANDCTTTTALQITEPDLLEICENTTTNPSCLNGDDGCILLTACGGTTGYNYLWSNGETSNEICDLSADTYNCTITDNNGCTTSAMITLNNPANPLALVSSNSSDAACDEGGSIDLTINGGGTPYSFLWSNGETTQNINDLSIGTYACTISDSDGCSVVTPVYSIALLGNDMTADPATTTSNDCFGNSNGTIDITINGSATPFQYNWSNSATTEDLDNLSSGLYSCTVTDTNGCSIVVSNILVDQPAAPMAVDALSQIDILCPGAGTGSISLEIGGGTAPYTYVWNTGATTSGISNLESGSYSCIITDANNCTLNSNSINISQLSSAISVADINTVDISCFNEQDGSIFFNTLGGTAPYNYLWNNGITTASISDLPAGDYQCTITDDNECTFVTEMFNLNMPSDIIIENETINNATCGTEGAISLTVSGGDGSYSYQWSNGSNGNPLAQAPAGNYTCTITDNTGCSIVSASYNVILTGSDLSIDNTSITPVACSGDSNGAISLTISGTATPYQYNWSNGENSGSINNLSSGFFTCTVTDANNCSIIVDDIEVTEPENPLEVININQINVLCLGESTGSLTVEVSGGTAPYSYLWNTNGNSAEISGLNAGVYSCTITDSNDCTISTINTTITEPSSGINFTGLSVIDLTCNGNNDGQISLTGMGGSAPYTYLWNNGLTTQNISNLEEGPYQCTITDANQCSFVSNSFTINSPVPITLNNFVVTNATCDGGGSIDLNNLGGTSPYTYSWSNGASGNPLVNANSGDYLCTITDNMGCTLVTQGFNVLLEDSDLNLSAYNSLDIDCFGNTDGAINLAITGSATPFTFQWSNGASTQNISNLAPDNYVCTITDANGCSVISSPISIDQPSNPLTLDNINSNDISCANAANGNISLNLSGGTAPYSYTWNFGGDSSSINDLSPGTYVCTVTDDNGCTVSTTAISISGPSSIELTSPILVDASCGQGGSGSIDISVSGGETPYTYLWNSGPNTQDINNIPSGSYTCTITDNSGCTLVSEEFIINNTGSDLSIDNNTVTPISCFGEADGSISLSIIGTATPFTFQWSNNETTQNISNLIAGIYSCTITDANNCTSISPSIEVSQPMMALTVSNNTVTDITCFNENNGSILLEIGGGTPPYDYQWNNSEITNSIDSLTPGDYTCEITDAMGCIISSEVFSINELNSLELTSILTENVVCGQGNIGSIDISVSGGLSPYSYLWSNGATTADLSGLTAGSYTCTITDNNNCILETNNIVIDDEGSDLQIITESAIAVTCFGENDGSITLEANGSATPFSYLWNNGATTSTIDNLTAATYSCTITDTNGCFISSSNIIVEQPGETISLSDAQINNSSCSGQANGTVFITMQGGTAPYTYLWSTGDTDPEINNLSVGEYTCTVTDLNNCSFVVGPLIVDIPTSLELTNSNTANANCTTGGFIQIEIEGGTSPYTYLWNNGSNAQNLFNIPAGTYVCEVTDSQGCTFSTEEIIVFNDGTDLSWNATNDLSIACFGNNDGSIDIDISGTATPFQYIWSNGETTEDIDNLSSGLYSCTITDANSCSIVLPDIVITEPNSPLSENGVVQNNPLCADINDGSILLNIIGGNSPYTYLWNNEDATNNPMNLDSGNYVCTVTDFNGCQFISTPIAIVAPQEISLLTLEIEDETEGDASGSIEFTLFGGVEPFSYLWSNGETTQNIINLQGGEYNCTITDANGCTTVEGPFIVENIVSTSDIRNNGFRVYPNPTSDIINIESKYPMGKVRLLDVHGVYHSFVKTSGNDLQVPLSDLPEGVYIIEISFENGQQAYERVVKIQ